MLRLLSLFFVLLAWSIPALASDPPKESTATEPDYSKFRTRWPFTPVQPVEPPAVQNSKWIKTGVDNFILAGLEAKALSPAPSVEKRALLRRATYDLTGLPPTPEEIASFLADNSTAAFEKVIDRLLASPHYGEKWGRHWLDVVRYADSLDARGSGGEGDIAEAYRYRDWVVQAFNNDLPYDEFIKQQIAGDLLPSPHGEPFNTNGLIATAVYAIGEWGTGDADKEKMLTDIVDDQIDLTGRAFLGLTLACARCHDHKFDPISIRDYYGLAGIFFSSRIIPNPGAKTAGTPVLRIPLASPEAVAQRAAAQKRIQELDSAMATERGEAIIWFARDSISSTARTLAALESCLNGSPADAKLAGQHEIPAALLQAWASYLGWGSPEFFTRLQENLRGTKGVSAWSNGRTDTPSATINRTDVDVPIGTLTLPPRSVSVHPSPTTSAGILWKSPISGRIRISGSVADADEKCGDGFDWSVRWRRGGKYQELARGSVPNGGHSDLQGNGLTDFEVAAGDELELLIEPKGEYTCDTTAITFHLGEIRGEERVWDLTRDVLAASDRNPVPDQFGNANIWSFVESPAIGQRPKVPAGSIIARWLDAPDVDTRKSEAAALQRRLEDLLRSPAPSGDPDSELFVALTNPESAFWKRINLDILPKNYLAHLQSLRAERASLQNSLGPAFPMTHGFQEGGTPQTPYDGFHDVRVHLRGRYERLGDIVPRRFPLVLAGHSQPAIAKGSGRLELARWIASKDHPLTARVMVNRIWQHHFGEGIVRTPNNFGHLGGNPTHPQLLDWLAAQFVSSGWSIKSMHKLMMLSAAYQQSTSPLPATLEADPDNLLFGWMKRRRLAAEEIRDSLLLAAGKLDRSLSGPAVRDFNSPRRTLYLMTIRSDRATYQALFDAADPTAIIEKRVDSTVAPQALFMLNHPFAITQAKALAARLAQFEQPSHAVQWLYETLYGRPATEHEVQLGLAALPRAETGSPDESAWLPYSQVLLCSNEFVYLD